MIQDIKQGFYRITKEGKITDLFFLDEESIFVCSARIGKLTSKKEIKSIIEDIQNHSEFLGEAIFVETVSTNIAANKPIEKHGIANAAFMYTEINEWDIKGILSQVVHIRYPLTGKKKTYSNSCIVRSKKDLQSYKVLVDGKWQKARLSQVEYELIKRDLRGEVGFAKNIVLENGEVVEIGIIDDIMLS